MSVPYAISGVTGDGTENSPYQVTTMDQMFECCAVEDAYVCLMNDINCHFDPIYKDLVARSLVINCAKFYSSGTRKAIIGWNCDNTYNSTLQLLSCICNTVAGTIIDNISFEGCITKLGVISTKIISTEAYFVFSSTCEISNCNFSFFVDFSRDNIYDSVRMEYLYGGIFKNCSLNFSCNVYRVYSTIAYCGFMPTRMDDCMLYMDRLFFSINNTGEALFNKLYHCTVYVTNGLYRISGSYNNNSMLLYSSDCENNVFYFDGVVISYSGQNDNISYTSIYPNVVCNKITGSVSIRRSDQGNSVYTSNPDNLSNPDFLRSCGIVI